MYACADSCVNDLIENNICDKINSHSCDSSNSPSFVTNTSDRTLELKPLPDSVKYIFFCPNETFHVIITSDLNEDQESKLLKVLRENKEAIGWILGDIKDIGHFIVQHRIHLKDNAKSYRDQQRRLNRTCKKSSKKKSLSG